MDATLTWAMIASMGLYQGFDPAMGWLAAAGRGFQHRAARPIASSIAAFALGHYLAMISVLVPLASIMIWTTLHPRAPIVSFGPATGAATPVLAAGIAIFGLFKIFRPHHPRVLARIPPDRRIRWSFAAAVLHCGSPLMMLVPFLALAMPFATPLCGARGTVFLLLPLALLVPAVMIVPLYGVAGIIGFVVWRFLGLGALTRLWINFDIGWGVMNVLMAWMAISMQNGHVGSLH